MSKYTTEVRYICESYAGLTESKGFDSIEEIIDKAYPHIFQTSEIPMFNGETAEHRALLFKKILLQYYTREIGYETVGLWKLKLNQKLKLIMPFYNQLYESELIKYNPLENVSNTQTHEGGYTDNEKADNLKVVNDDTVNHAVGNSVVDNDVILRHVKTTSQGDDVRTNVINSNSDTWTLFSDTPQGGIDGINNAGSSGVGGNAYLTNATHVISTPNGQSITDEHGTITEKFNPDGDKKDNTHTVTDVDNTSVTNNATRETEDNEKNKIGTDEYENKSVGKIGVETYSEMLMKYRKTFLNIDKMVIDEMESLFMQLW